MALWENLEADIEEYALADTTFSARDYAEFLDVETWEASAIIKSYQSAQRAKRSKTKYVIHRVPATRTRNARWRVGVKTKNVNAISDGYYDDVRVKWVNAACLDLSRIGQINPRQRRQIEERIHAVVDGALVLLKSAVAGGMSPEDN